MRSMFLADSLHWKQTFVVSLIELFDVTFAVTVITDTSDDALRCAVALLPLVMVVYVEELFSVNAPKSVVNVTFASSARLPFAS